MRGLRNAIRLIHLYLGLSLGLLFAMTGLTGSFLVFYPEIDDWITPAVYAARSNARPESYEALYRRLLETYPERPAHWRIEIPEQGGPIQARSLSAEDMAGLTFAPRIVWMDPRDNRDLRDVQWGRFFVTIIYDLHYRLLLGTLGGIVMGVAGLFAMGLIATGVWVWWPKAGRVASSFSFKRHAPLHGKLFDIHKLIGIYSGIVLLIISATGVMISLPGLVQPLLSLLSAPNAAPSFASAPAPGLARISLDAALAIASAKMPDGTLKWIDTPGGPTEVYVFRFRLPGEPAIRFPNSAIWVEQYSGEVLGTRQAPRDTLATQVIDWEHPLHTGEALGLPGKWLALLAGLLPAALFVTGVWRWLIRRSP
jgi:uncharacterized iron-regulated membrane protein